jgi:hypothetical protein
MRPLGVDSLKWPERGDMMVAFRGYQRRMTWNSLCITRMMTNVARLTDRNKWLVNRNNDRVRGGPPL